MATTLMALIGRVNPRHFTIGNSMKLAWPGAW
jgi:hypothetical protein